MLRLGVLAVLPALARLGVFGEVEDGTALILVAVSLVGTAVELLGNSRGGKKKRGSVLFFGMVCVFTLASQAAVLLHPHFARAAAAHLHHHVGQAPGQAQGQGPGPGPGPAQGAGGETVEAAEAAEEEKKAGPKDAEHHDRRRKQPLLAKRRGHDKKAPPPPRHDGPKHAAKGKAAGGGEAGAAAQRVEEYIGPTLAPVDLSKHFGGVLAEGGGGEQMRTISLVFPCAEERANALNTVDRFCARTPEDRLAEIIVVDDGSSPPLKKLFAEDSRRLDQNPKCKLKILRHEMTIGLMAAKLTGGKAATGDVIGFFDCHCSPNDGWYKEILSQVTENPRRMVVPAITDLDLDTFDEKKNSAVNAKCYLTFDADFKWFDDESDFIPTISGGLVAMGRAWFNLTGGFDEEMHGWGGENLDQSLRAWLCGGEITRAKSSRIAHMWRTGDPRTGSRYHVRAKPTNNRGRVAAAWFDAFLPAFRGGKVPDKEVRNYDVVKRRLGCRPFAYFLYRFRKVYLEGGVIARKVFHLQEKASGLCLSRGFGATTPKNCATDSRDQQMQLGNVDRQTGKCCSGIRMYGGNDCLDFFDSSGPHWYSCDVTGQNGNQQYRITPEGRIKRDNGECLYVHKESKKVKKTPCDQLKGGQGVFERLDEFEPKEYVLYKEEIARHRFETDLPGLLDN